jgi:hypothetical protein
VRALRETSEIKEGPNGLGCAEIKEKSFFEFGLRFKIQIKRGLNILDNF